MGVVRAMRIFVSFSRLGLTSHLTIFCTMEPCLMCLGAIMLSGIRKIVYAYEDVMGGGTGCDLSGLKPLYSNNHMSVCLTYCEKKV